VVSSHFIHYIQSAIPILRIADALRSQYDAHIDGDSKMLAFNNADCTHWCIPGSIFPYMLTVMFNHLRQAV
jgi:hypothetical protein